MIPSFDNNPCFELFSAATEVIKYWKLKGKFSKEFEPHSKSNIYYLHFGGVSSLTTPIDEKHSLLHRAGTGRGFSVLKERLEEELAALAENDREENGGFTFSQEEIAHLRELACSADGTVLADEQLLTLIETAMQDFLSGRYPSAQAAAEDLQSRAAIYLAEQHG